MVVDVVVWVNEEGRAQSMGSGFKLLLLLLVLLMLLFMLLLLGATAVPRQLVNTEHLFCPLSGVNGGEGMPLLGRGVVSLWGRG